MIRFRGLWNEDSESDLESEREISEEDDDPAESTKDEDVAQHGGGNMDRVSKEKLEWEIWEEKNDKIVKRLEKEGKSYQYEDDEEKETAKKSKDFDLTLYRYQEEWLNWALKQEESSDKRGGILADEAGMGKTIQAIALVLKKREEEKSNPANVAVSSSSTTEIELPKVKSTLVICPMLSDLNRWEVEIVRCTHQGKRNIKVLLYRKKENHDFCTYDFVLTTYKQVASETQKECASTSKISVVVTSKSVLHSVKWERIILDDAHEIKNWKSKTALAVFGLNSTYRWALTGTPFHNDARELYSLIRFLQIFPFSYYFCYKCGCKSVNPIPLTKQCSCTHWIHFWWFKRNIVKKLEKGGRRAHLARILLGQRIFKSILLRRTKDGRMSDLQLPPRTFNLRLDALDINEEKDYQSLYEEYKSNINGLYGPDGYERIMRLRKVLDHPSLASDTIEVESSMTSTKIDALMEEIQQMLERDISAKAVVFSQFKSFLELIEYVIQKSKMNCVLLVEGVTAAARNKVISTFNSDPNCIILLASPKAASAASNLTVASNVFLMEPWNSMSAEKQACDKIYRIGQRKPVRIVKFIIEKTIEEQIVKQQERKLASALSSESRDITQNELIDMIRGESLT